jgi:hypothetical protein
MGIYTDPRTPTKPKMQPPTYISFVCREINEERKTESHPFTYPLCFQAVQIFGGKCLSTL